MLNQVNNIGVDTVRFVAKDGYDIEENPQTGELTFYIGRFAHQKLIDGDPVFEFSYHAFKEAPLLALGDNIFLLDIIDTYAARFLRIDLSMQIVPPASMLMLSYLRYYGRRSLQKKREPWAYWPGREKCLKFYDKRKEVLKKDEKWLGGDQTMRFEVEYRGRAVNKIFNGLTLNYDLFMADYHHLASQIPQLSGLILGGLQRRHVKAVEKLTKGEKLNWKQKRALGEIDVLQSGLS